MVFADREAIKNSVEATKVEYRQLGKCGLRVSIPILGAMSFGDKSWKEWILDEDKVGKGFLVIQVFISDTHVGTTPAKRRL